MLPSSMRVDAGQRMLPSSSGFLPSTVRFIATAHRATSGQQGFVRQLLYSPNLLSQQQRIRQPLRWLQCSASQQDDQARSEASDQQLEGLKGASNALSAVPENGIDVLNPLFWRRLNLDDGLRQLLSELPGTKNLASLALRAGVLSNVRSKLSKGLLPSPAADWPAEPFRSAFLASLDKMEMPRFTRRHPQLLNPLLKQMLSLIHDFEAKLEEISEQQQQQPQPQQQQLQMQPQQGQQSEEQDSESGAEGGEPDWEEMTQEQLEEMMERQGQSQAKGGKELEISLEQQKGSSAQDSDQQEQSEQEAEMEEAIAKAAEELIDKFEEKWKPAMENLQEAESVFDDLDELMEGPVGYDMSHAVWQNEGWREMKELRKKLENLKELRDLIKKLGRASGKGPKRRAPQELEARSARRGVIRSSLQPEETAGLTRSGDLSRMLPFEAHLLAAGWPRDGPNGETREGSRAARMLHMVRRAERGLMSYDRTGWLEDEPCKPTGRLEYRPAAELGPVIVCLDTSGSMSGARETVAKAVALEAMRGAHRQQRACYLYAFSGPQDVKELELKVDAGSLTELLNFLMYSFGGGTDVDRPLELSLDRLEQRDWSQADILMVTDGEIAPPGGDVLKRLDFARKELGLEVHGLLVGRSDTSPAMDQVCDHITVFKSWNAVGGSRNDYQY